MTTSSLVRTRDYLTAQRRAILARAIVGSALGALPVPFLDDWAIGAVLGSGYRRIAAAHQVDLAPDAVRALVHGKSEPANLAELASAGIASRIAGRAARRMLVALATVNRARAAARTFVTMTLFDHYCARLHTGLALDAPTAAALRDEIDRTIAQTPGALVLHPFRRGAAAALRQAVRAPLQLADLASRGALRRLLARGGQVADAEAVDELDRAVDTALTRDQGLLSRTVSAVETQLSAEGNPYLDAALDTLDHRWRARVAAGVR